MKKKLGLMLLITMISFLLIGCDLGGATTADTTAPTTTASTTTTTNVSNTTTTTTSTTTTTTTTTSQPFNRQDLLDMLVEGRDELPTTDELNGEITMYMMVLGLDTEEELYDMMVSAQDMMVEMMDVSSLEDLQAWWMATKASGYDQMMLSTTLMNVIVNGVDMATSMMSVEDIQAEIAQNELDLSSLFDDLSQAYLDQNAVRDDVVAYTNTLSTNSSDALALYDAIVNQNEALDYYYNMEDMYLYGDVYLDYSTLMDLESNLEDYYYYSYTDVNGTAQSYLDANDTLLEGYSYDEVSLYEMLLDYYGSYLYYQYAQVDPLMSTLSEVMDSNNEYVIDVVNNFYWDYSYAGGLIQGVQWEIEYLQWTIEDLSNQILEVEMLNMFSTYIENPQSMLKLGLLISSFYGSVDDLIMDMSSDTFDFFYNMSMDMTEEMTPPSTPEEVLAYITPIVEIITILHDSFDTTELANMQQLMIDFATMYVDTLDLTETEKTEIITLMTAQISDYFDMVDSVFTEVLNFVDNLTVSQIAAIMTYSQIAENSENQDEIVIGAAVVLDELLGNDNLDYELLINVFTTVMFDVTSNFDPDLTALTALQTDLLDTFDEILGYAAIIKDYDYMNLTEAQMVTLGEFQDLVETIPNFFMEPQTK